MPDPQPQKPRWSQPPEPPAPNRPPPTARPIAPAGTTSPANPQTVPVRVPPPARALPTYAAPALPPVPVAPPNPQPIQEPNFRRKLRAFLATPGVLFTISMVAFMVVPMVGALLVIPTRPVTRSESPTAAIEPVESVPEPNPPPPVAEQQPPPSPPPTPTASVPNASAPPPSPPSAPVAPARPQHEPPPPDIARHTFTENEARRLNDAVKTRVPLFASEYTLQSMLQECELKSQIKIRVDDASIADLKLTTKTTVSVKGDATLQAQLDGLAAAGLAWSPEFEGAAVKILVTSERRVPQVTVTYAASEFVPQGRIAFASIVVPRLAARNSWARVPGRCSLEIDEDRNVVIVEAPWTIHSEIEKFFVVVRERKSHSANGIQRALGSALQVSFAVEKDAVSAIHADSRNGAANFGNEQFELLGVFPELKSISLRGTRADGVGISRLPNARLFWSLDFTGSPFNDEALAELDKLPYLTRLILADTKVTNAGLKALPNLKQLKELDLSRATVSDPGMEFVARCPELKELNLSKTDITDGGGAAICDSLKLVQLILADTAVGDGTLQRLAQAVEHPMTLDVRRTRVSRRGLEYLSGAQYLQQLSVGSVAMKPADYAPLAGIRRLKNLTLADCTFDAEFFAAVRLPTVKGLTLDGCSFADGSIPDMPNLGALTLLSTDVSAEVLAKFVQLPKFELIVVEGKDTPPLPAETKDALTKLNAKLKFFHNHAY